MEAYVVPSLPAEISLSMVNSALTLLRLNDAVATSPPRLAAAIALAASIHSGKWRTAGLPRRCVQSVFARYAMAWCASTVEKDG